MADGDLIRLQRKGGERLAAREVKALAAELSRKVRGEVRFDDGARGLYATDASNYRQVPIGVVVPRDAADVVEALAIARRFGAPILARGGGTSLAGQCCNVAVVLDLSKYMNRIVDLDADRKVARVQPGLILDHLRDAAEEHHLTFGPDPATHAWCTLGGMMGNNSCGVHALMAGKTVDNVIELDAITYDGTRVRAARTSDAEVERLVREGGREGEIYAKLRALRDRYAPLIRARYPQIPRRVSGFNLDELLPERGFHVGRALVGSESTCAVVLEATVQLVDSPRGRCLVVLGYDDVFSACDHLEEVLAAKPIGLEGIDDRLVDYMRRMGMHEDDVGLLPAGGGWLIVELSGDTADDAEGRARELEARLRAAPGAPDVRVVADRAKQERIWKIRESGLAATAHVPGMRPAWPGWEDSAVAPQKLASYLRDLRALLDRSGYACALYGHFGQGCVHTRIDFDLFTAAGVASFRRFVEQAADLVVRYGGSLSGEHGDGQARGELLHKMYGPELVSAFREFKSIWDPDWKMNPGKVVEPHRLDANLRLGPAYRPADVTTHFAFEADGGSFARATLRCVGVGACRRTEGGTMCPSFQVTREEMHTTRGRARLLFEMMAGEEVRGGFEDEHVKEALDLCLACKGCKGDCPVKVDVATYKAEFLAHYYEHRMRPRAAYSMGLIHTWARLASHVPSIANFFASARGLSGALKAAAGIAAERRMPTFARQTFKRWFARRERRNAGRPEVVLWPDTFNDHFTPEIAIAAVEVLEAAGFEVRVPLQDLCCGRPLYDWGMLDRAEDALRRILVAMRPHLEAGTPVVVLEPSCAAVFRDEMGNLLPHDEDAKRLRGQVMVLSELLDARGDELALRSLGSRALVQPHCHQAAVIGMEAERRVLSRAGLDVELLDGGCCGMAGSFGFERGRRHEVSMLVGERAVLPAVRRAPAGDRIVADGFSCREQIAQGTERRPLHLAQVLRDALDRSSHEGGAPHPVR